MACLETNSKRWWCCETLTSHCLLLRQINNAKQAALETKDRAEDLQDRLNTTMDSFERDKNKTKELIQRVKDYLMGQCWADAPEI